MRRREKFQESKTIKHVFPVKIEKEKQRIRRLNMAKIAEDDLDQNELSVISISESISSEDEPLSIIEEAFSKEFTYGKTVNTRLSQVREKSVSCEEPSMTLGFNSKYSSS